MSTENRSRRDSETDVQSYYDGESIRFYQGIWGGTDLHVGIYDKEPDENAKDRPDQIKRSSLKTKSELWSEMKKHLNPDFFKEGLRMADFGSAYGGQAVTCIKNGATFVSCVEISVKENIECRKNIEKELMNLHISMPGERSFTDTGEANESFHVVWSQDSLLHAGEFREKTVFEAARYFTFVSKQ